MVRIFLLAVVFAIAQTAAAQQLTELTELAVGQTVDGSLIHDEEDVYALHLEADQFVTALFEK